VSNRSQFLKPDGKFPAVIGQHSVEHLSSRNGSDDASFGKFTLGSPIHDSCSHIGHSSMDTLPNLKVPVKSVGQQIIDVYGSRFHNDTP
jgi:hypothetical protein